MKVAEVKERWHLDKRLNIGHILTTAAMVASVFWWGSGVETRIQTNKGNITHNKEIFTIKQQHIKKTVDVIDGKVDKMDTKIDKLLDNINGRNK